MKKILKYFSVILTMVFFLSFFEISYISAVCPTDVVCCPCTTGGCTGGLVCVDGQCQESGKTTFCSFSNNKTIENLINEITKWLTILVVVVVPLTVLFGAFYILTAAGDLKRSAKGKQIIIWASIALIIFLLTKAFVSILRYFIGF